MKKRIAQAASRLVVNRPGTVAAVLILITALSAWRVTKLTINYNQIELIPQDLPSVVATKNMIEMIGAVGFLLIPIKGKDLAHTKKVADDLAVRLTALPEVRKVVYKQDVKFVRDRIPLYIQTEDLAEGSKRVRKYLRYLINKHNPFAITLREPKEVKLDLSDLVEKYRRMHNKAVDDPYYVDKNYEAIMLVVKPTGLNTDLDFIRRMMAAVDETIAAYSRDNPHGAILKEHYNGFAPGATITYGYTGGYKRNLDDSDNIREAIIPTAGVAFLGIIIYLLIALRRPLQILLIMSILGIAITISFAFCELAIGELNTVTALMVAILMGLGIDYGIHFLFRIREEYTRHKALPLAIERTLEHSGAASGVSAVTTAAALYILTLSDFRGFSDFGLVMGTGVILSFVIMYLAIPVFYLLVHRRAPDFVARNLTLKQLKKGNYDQLKQTPYPWAKQILLASLLLTAGLLYFASRIEFDYDSRSLMASNRPSVILQEEIGERWNTSSDPVAIYTDSLEETKALYDHLTPVPEESTIDTVVSLFTLVPPQAQQEANVKILHKMKKRLAHIDKNWIEDEKVRGRFDELVALLDVQPFGIEAIPPHLERQFRPAPESKYKGYLTYVYPKTSLWDGEELVAFAEEVDTIDVQGQSYHSAGVAVLMAHLAKLVLRDGFVFTLLSALAILLIAWMDFRSIKAAAFTVLPLLAGLLWMLGLMTILNRHINFMNVVVFPLIFGYGISAGVHIYHRFAESGSVMVAIRRTGGAVLASSVTTSIGWAALIASDHRGLISMGILACFGIASTLFVSLTVLPSLLQVTKRRTKTVQEANPNGESHDVAATEKAASA